MIIGVVIRQGDSGGEMKCSPAISGDAAMELTATQHDSIRQTIALVLIAVMFGFAVAIAISRIVLEGHSRE